MYECFAFKYVHASQWIQHRWRLEERKCYPASSQSFCERRTVSGGIFLLVLHCREADREAPVTKAVQSSCLILVRLKNITWNWNVSRKTHLNLKTRLTVWRYYVYARNHSKLQNKVLYVTINYVFKLIMRTFVFRMS